MHVLPARQDGDEDGEELDDVDEQEQAANNSGDTNAVESGQQMAASQRAQQSNGDNYNTSSSSSGNHSRGSSSKSVTQLQTSAQYVGTSKSGEHLSNKFLPTAFSSHLD